MVLDCTLRDGGYYNQWSFHLDLVSPYLHALDAAKIDAIEIGFRSPPKKGFLGPYAYCTDEFLSTLPLPKNILIGVMINAKDYLVELETFSLSKSFKKSSESPVKLVRIAAHFDEVTKSQVLAAELKALGYLVGFNLMQSSTKSTEEIKKKAEEISSWGTIDVLYFADSLGNMNEETTLATIQALRWGWKGALGIHTHDNMGKALTNTLTAIEKGVTWVDATVLGMGRGAGNAKLEYILFELKKRNLGDYYPDAIFPLVIEQFKGLKNQYGWGDNLLYYLSAEYQIHPTFIQELLNEKEYETEQILNALESLKKDKEALSFSSGRLKKATLATNDSTPGSWSAEGWAKGQEVLVLANGPGIADHAVQIERYIKRKNPIVLSLNINKYINRDLITAYVICNQTRFLIDYEKYRTLNSPIIMPLAKIPKSLYEKIQDVIIYNYGMNIEQQRFSISDRECTIPFPLAAAYAFAVSASAGASKILLAGFDGFDFGDTRHREMEEVFLSFKKLTNTLPIIALTPTLYSITQTSIYSPEF